MGKETCVCGHDRSEHEKCAMGETVCFHDDDPENPLSPVCSCMEFKAAEAATAAKE